MTQHARRSRRPPALASRSPILLAVSLAAHGRLVEPDRARPPGWPRGSRFQPIQGALDGAAATFASIATAIAEIDRLRTENEALRDRERAAGDRERAARGGRARERRS